jgi:hypothetical protein
MNSKIVENKKGVAQANPFKYDKNYRLDCQSNTSLIMFFSQNPA